MSLSSPSTIFSVPPASPFSGSPLGGFTGFGFEVPQGDPGSIESAAAGVRRLATGFGAQSRAIRVGAQVAVQADGGWVGSASAAFADYSGHLTGVLSANEGVCERAGAALSQLGHALTHAQTVTRQALADCETYSKAHTKAVGDAQTAALAHQTAVQNAQAAPDPVSKASYTTQAGKAHTDLVNAQGAASTAEKELTAAQKRGHDAYEAYMQEAGQLAQRIAGAASELRSVHGVHGGAPVPVSVTPADVALANLMLAGAGSLRGMAGAMDDPAELKALACGPVDPGTVLAFQMGYDEKLHVAEIAAKDKGAQGGFWNVIPGGQTVKTFVSDAASSFAGDARQAVTGTVYIVGHPASDAQWLWSHSIFSHDSSPLGSQQQSVTPLVNWGKQVVDYSAWSHGQYAAGAGNATGNLLFAFGLWKGPGALSKAYGAAPEATAYGATNVADVLGARGAAEGADPISQMANPMVVAVPKTYAQAFIDNPVGVTKDAVATRASVYAIKITRVDLDNLANPAVQPKIIVVKRLPNGTYVPYGR